MIKIMDEAKRNNCVSGLPVEKPQYTIEFSDGSINNENIQKETEAYTKKIDRKMYKK
jgi:hypothetical protein